MAKFVHEKRGEQMQARIVIDGLRETLEQLKRLEELVSEAKDIVEDLDIGGIPYVDTGDNTDDLNISVPAAPVMPVMPDDFDERKMPF